MKHIHTLRIMIFIAILISVMGCKMASDIVTAPTATSPPSPPADIGTLPAMAETATLVLTQLELLIPTEEPTVTTIPSTATQAGPFTLISSAFQDGQSIPQLYTCQGKDISPPLKWSNVPTGTQSLALIVDDPDAPGGIFVHWVLFNIPSDMNELPEGVAKTEVVEGIGIHGKNGFGYRYYRGPCPPPGNHHRYFFKLYALDTTLDLPPGSNKADVEAAMQGHILDQVEIVGIYRRY